MRQFFLKAKTHNFITSHVDRKGQNSKPHMVRRDLVRECDSYGLF